MSLAEYIRIVLTVHARTPAWRLGQTYFNTLTQGHPGLAEKVRGSDVDPFYLDERIPEFIAFLANHWDEFYG